METLKRGRREGGRWIRRNEFPEGPSRFQRYSTGICCDSSSLNKDSGHVTVGTRTSSVSTMNQAVTRAFLKLLPSPLPPSLRTTPANLYQVLSRYPNDGVGQKVHQIRWTAKGIENCCWQVTRTRLKHESTHGKAWGKLVWRGECGLWSTTPVAEKTKGNVVSKHEERIPGSLKYKWSTGTS